MILDGSLPVLKILADASATIAEGEVLQLITANDISATEEAYLQVIAAKTAALFSAATKIGAVVAGRTEAEIEAVEQYGHYLGMAFQLIDDMLDFSAREVELGKAIGDDFRDGKMTLPIVLAIARADEEERAFWHRTMEEQEQNDGDLDHAIALLRRHRTLEQTFERAREFGDRAEAALRIFPDSPARRAMLDVVAFCLQRGY
jgi:octaprenyl-diphosphate synthase